MTETTDRLGATPIDPTPTLRDKVNAINSLAREIAAGGLADWRAQSIHDLCLKLGPFVEFVEYIAGLDAEDDIVDGEAFVMENDDAWSNINGLIHEARELLGREVVRS